MSAAVTPMPMAKTNTRQSGLGSSHGGASVASITERSSRKASAIPAADPRKASNRLSVKSCRSNRARPAPTAARIVSSRSRATPRASSRPPRFAQATARINNTSAPMIPITGSDSSGPGVPVPREEPPPILA